jgi:hypothetical protein
VPTFNPATVTVSFSEEAVVGTRRLLELATVDAPNQIVSYEIVGDAKVRIVFNTFDQGC